VSKARDLANAGTALTTVSATELGYLDGVTSAVQTQINAKQATVSGVNDTEIGYLDGVTSGIQTQLDAKEPTLPSQTGNSGKYLTTNGTDKSWGTISIPASGMTLISRTTFSASSSVDIDNLFSTTYENYLVSIQCSASTVTQLLMRGRYGTTTHTGSNYQFGFSGVSTSASTFRTVYNYDVSRWELGDISSGNPNIYNLTFYRPSSSGQLAFTGTTQGRYNGYMLNGGGFVESSQTWGGLNLFPNSGTITGQITVYGLAKA
jgi:hypothetical protein